MREAHIPTAVEGGRPETGERPTNCCTTQLSTRGQILLSSPKASSVEARLSPADYGFDDY